MTGPQRRAGMSEREYAAHACISRGAVQKARASGRLVLHADGSINAAASDARRAQATDPSMQRGRHESSLRPVPEAAVGAVSETLREQGLPAPAVAGGMTYLQARTANEVLKAQERRIRLQRLKGEVVDRARAIALVFRLARQERDAWAGWPARVAAMMAADLGIGAHAMQTVLETHVRQHPGRARRPPRGIPVTTSADFWTAVQKFCWPSTAPGICCGLGATGSRRIRLSPSRHGPIAIGS